MRNVMRTTPNAIFSKRELTAIPPKAMTESTSPLTVCEILSSHSKSVPAWRWGLARFLEASADPIEGHSADHIILAAAQFLRDRVNRVPPDSDAQVLADAISIFERNERDRWLLEAHLLLKKRLAGISRKLKLNPVVMKLYEKLFFDVRRRLSQTMWIATHAIGSTTPHFGYEDHDLGPIWRIAGYYFGEDVLDAVVAVTTGTGLDNFTVEKAACAAVLKLGLVRFLASKPVGEMLRWYHS